MKDNSMKILGFLTAAFLLTINFLSMGKEVPILTVLSPMDLHSIDPLGCFKSQKILEVQADICVKKHDQFVSESIAKTGAWEQDNVSKLMKAVSLYKDAVFIDAGANIGMYTVMVASMGRDVVAVDAMADNLAYISKSLRLGNNEDKVVLVHNSISNTHTTLFPVHDGDNNLEENPGSQKLVDEQSLQDSNLKVSGPPVTSIMLPDILSSIPIGTIILKIDIEGYECKALLSPGVFSSGHFIPYIFMEWNQIAGPLRSSLCPDLDGLIYLLKTNGYTARDVRSLGKFPDRCLQNPVTDVIWVHETAIPIWKVEIVVDCHFDNSTQFKNK